VTYTDAQFMHDVSTRISSCVRKSSTSLSPRMSMSAARHCSSTRSRSSTTSTTLCITASWRSRVGMCHPNRRSGKTLNPTPMVFPATTLLGGRSHGLRGLGSLTWLKTPHWKVARCHRSIAPVTSQRHLPSTACWPTGCSFHGRRRRRLRKTLAVTACQWAQWWTRRVSKLSQIGKTLLVQ
jgi:hypothetical protein